MLVFNLFNILLCFFSLQPKLVYHRKCIDPWLTENKKTCPMCKRRVISGSDADDSGSENNVNINSSERTPLLTDSSSSDIVPAPQYTTPVTLRLHSPGNDEGSVPLLTMISATPSPLFSLRFHGILTSSSAISQTGP